MKKSNKYTMLDTIFYYSSKEYFRKWIDFTFVSDWYSGREWRRRGHRLSRMQRRFIKIEGRMAKAGSYHA
jgi:hypothetical protein